MQEEKKKKKKEVAVIGAGFAGLSCAKRLKALGYEVTVYEGRDRVGGRVHTVEGVEYGGELIGNNHPTWQRLAKEYALDLEPLDGDTADPTLQDPIQVGGMQYRTEKDIRELNEQLDKLLLLISTESLKVGNPNEPWNEPEEVRALDQVSVGTVLAGWHEPGTALFEYARMILERDNLVSIYQQSWLGLLCQVRGGGGLAFWDNVENAICRQGNQELAVRMARDLKVKLNVRITMSLCCATTPTKVTLVREAKYSPGEPDLIKRDYNFVVLAIPNALYSSISFGGLRTDRLDGHMMQSGVASKLMCRASDFWSRSGLSINSQSVLYGESWPTKRGFNVFLGGERLAATPTAAITHGLERLYGEEELFKLEKRVDYATEPFTMGGYSCPAPGQMLTTMKNLQEVLPRERLAFAGEHCSPAFFGYMEGALESGERTAARVHEWLTLEGGEHI